GGRVCAIIPHGRQGACSRSTKATPHLPHKEPSMRVHSTHPTHPKTHAISPAKLSRDFDKQFWGDDAGYDAVGRAPKLAAAKLPRRPDAAQPLAVLQQGADGAEI